MQCYGRFDNTEWAGLRSVSVDNTLGCDITTR